MLMQYVLAKGNRRTVVRLRRMRKEAQQDKMPRVALRVQGIMLSLDQYSPPEIARLLRVHRASVHSWICNWNAYGEDGLMEGYRSGRPSSLTGQQKEQLADIIESGPIAYGLQSGVWTSPIVGQIIREEFDVLYHPGHVRKLLKQLGFSVQRPATKLVRADISKQRRWIRYTYPNLKKTPDRKRQ